MDKDLEERDESNLDENEEFEEEKEQSNSNDEIQEVNTIEKQNRESKKKNKIKAQEKYVNKELDEIEKKLFNYKKLNEEEKKNLEILTKIYYKEMKKIAEKINNKLILKEIYERNKKKRQKQKKEKTEDIPLKNEEVEIEEKITQVIKDMAIMGDIVKEQILEEKQTHPEKYITIEEAVKNKNEENFIMGILAQNLEDQGVTVGIEKTSNTSEESQEEASTSLQFMINGMSNKKKFDFHFELGEEENEELLKNIEKQTKYNNCLRKKLAREFNIKEEEIIITNPKRGSYCVTVIFKTSDFNSLSKDNLMLKFKESEGITEKDGIKLGKLKDLHESLLVNGCKLNKNMLDARGNNKDGGWGHNEKRGGFPYNPPDGWIGFGLKVFNKYDGGNNDWLAYDNRNGEWAVAYHGVGRGQSNDQVKTITGLIANSNLKEGKNQAFCDSKDEFHPGKKVGKGVYCTPNIKTAEGYSGTTIVNGEKYKVVYMLRVRPDKIRFNKASGDYWVLNGLDEEIRPYRILIKKIN